MADGARGITDEELQKELDRLREDFEPGKWSGTIEDVFQAYGGLAEGFVRAFPRELQLAMADYDKGQFDARTSEIVRGLNKHMKTLRSDPQWGSQVAINGAKASAARDLATDPIYLDQRAAFQAALTHENERHLDMIYDAERETLRSLGLDPDHSPDGQSKRTQTHLDLAETYSDYRHNFEAFLTAEEALRTSLGEVAEIQNRHEDVPQIERLTEEIQKYALTLSQDEVSRREYNFQLTRGAYLEDHRREWQQRLDADLTHDLDQLERRNEREERGFLRLIARLDETIRAEETQRFETTGQPAPAELAARQAERSAFYIEAIQEFLPQQAERHRDRVDAVFAQNGRNAQALENAYQRHRNPPEVASGLEQAKAQIEDLKRRQAERSVAVELLHLAGNERR